MSNIVHYSRDGKIPSEIINELGNDRKVIIINSIIDVETQEVLIMSQAQTTIGKLNEFQNTIPEGMYESLESMVEGD